MQLRQSEALRVEYHHHRSVRHINAHLDNGGCNEYLCLATHKLLHLGILLLRLHPAVNLTYAELGEDVAQRSIAFFQILKVALLALSDERIDDIYLSSETYLLTNAVVERRHLIVKLVYGLHRLASRRQLVDNAHVEIAVYCHGEGARNWCGGHDKDVWRILTLCP